MVSEIAEETFGRNFMYFFIQGTTALILILAANTGYSAFPLLAVNLAKDKFIPRMFTVRGDRLGYSNGIIILGILSIVLIVAFQGQTEQLIPLYAVGVFIPFTLSQTGMMVKWIRQKPKGWISKLIINSTGALISLTVTIMFCLTKFAQVWPVLVFLPLIIYVFHRIKKHYEAVSEQLVDTVQRKASESNYQVTVIIPQFIPKKGWHNILHNQTSLMIRAHLLFRKDVIVTTVPYHLKK